MGRALILNATFEPLCVVAVRRAVVLVLREKAEVVHADTDVFRGARICLPAPSVVRLLQYVRVPYRPRAALSRRAVFLRDAHRCQYCGGRAENVDHVVPRSKGGRHEWENVVAACRRCNTFKRNRTPTEAGMRLSTRPAPPADYTWIAAKAGSVHPAWRDYLVAGVSA